MLCNKLSVSTDMKWMSFFFIVSCLLGLVQSLILLEEKRESTNSESVIRFPELLPPISIVDLTKASRRVSRVEAEKNKMGKRKVPPKKKPPRPPPPPNCVPLLSNCKHPAPPCCEQCAICHCQIFQTICIYRMGYPHC
ncbi:agouti-signaling [Pelobates cultripes]|uniref:Agouti-signaling protein n=2 Tax=Pelobates cultripes TaxID=61616 RepID=A0AAD1W7W9_PELCU|nr:agouti-signaling [Pelobates cultripes]